MSIEPVVLFNLILVGYLENLNSDRKIFARVQMRLDVLFFLGYDLPCIPRSPALAGSLKKTCSRRFLNRCLASVYRRACFLENGRPSTVPL
ncbi:transposase [Flavisolibacter nicotianae]|uniref:transposase n=1 Tax=Flavisolibacter nicotianae TaxID=2364882 RepID=UPI0037420899